MVRIRRTTEIFQLLDMVIDDPIAQVVQFDVFVVVQSGFPWSRLLADHGSSIR